MGFSLGTALRDPEIMIGGYDQKNITNITYINAFEFEGRWEIKIISFTYKGAERVLKEMSVVMLHSPYIVMSISDFEPIRAKLAEPCKQRMFRNTTSFEFYCEIDTPDVTLFAPLEVTVRPGVVISIPPKDYIDIVIDLLYEILDFIGWKEFSVF